MAYDGLLFVEGLSSGTKREKELVYAASKSHISKIAHRKQKRARREATWRFNTASHLQANRDCEDNVPNLHQDAGCYNSLRRANYCAAVDALHRYNVPVLYPDPLAISQHVDDSFGNPAIACSAQLMKAISFARLHLARSQAPTFMVNMMRTKDEGADLVRVTEARATTWLWTLWMSNVGLLASVVASVIPLLVRFTRDEEVADFEHMAMKLKNKSFNHLRSLLEGAITELKCDLLTTAHHVKALFREACARGDVEAMRCHVVMLERLVFRMKECNVDCDRVALWNDALPALLQMRRPTHDFSNITSDIITEIWTKGEQLVPRDGRCDKDLLDLVPGYILREAFFHLRRTFRFAHMRRSDRQSEKEEKMELLFQWHTTKAEYYMQHLLEYYLDSIDEVASGVSNNAFNVGERYIGASLALCLLHIYQKSFFDIQQANGTDVHESAIVIQPLLKQAVQLVKSSLSASERNKYGSILFWIVFVGAYAEERIQHYHSRLKEDQSTCDAENSWFQGELIKVASSRGIRRWSEAQALLDQFVWNELLEPTCNQWYDRLIGS